MPKINCRIQILEPVFLVNETALIMDTIPIITNQMAVKISTMLSAKIRDLGNTSIAMPNNTLKMLNTKPIPNLLIVFMLIL